MNQTSAETLLSMFESRIAIERGFLLSHPIYQELKTLESMRVFMKYHVFAVWDFMSLLKTLQLRLTTVTVPWVPSSNPSLSRFINEIVLAEESDEVGTDEFLSHFELYLLAMKEAGADCVPVQTFIQQVTEVRDIQLLLDLLKNKDGVFDFMKTTFQIISGETHEVASSFLFGREDVIPNMFQLLLSEMSLLDTDQFKRMKQYLERHIEIDGDHHGPLARKMLIVLCGNDPRKWEQAEVAALNSIRARIRLWDHIGHQLRHVSVSKRTREISQI